MGIFDGGTAEEGVEEGGFAYVAAAEEGNFGVWALWESAEMGGGEEELGGLGGEEGVRVLQLDVGGREGDGVGV